MTTHKPNVGLSRAATLVTVFTYAGYLVYRICFMFNWEAPVFSLVFLCGELYTFFSLALYFFVIWKPLKHTPHPSPPGLSVDILIPTLNEDLDILRKTVLGAIKIRYPHETYLLDDGNRPECRLLAEELGCHYIARKEHVHAKAGNINHALGLIKGDYVVVFDSDHVPRPEFLDRTLGYFSDENLAFVQVPQHFYNTDSFAHTIKKKKKEVRNENDGFFQMIMPGLDGWGAAYCVGTGVVFRRAALDDIGGLSTESITEDLLTSLRLYKRGWKSLYHDEILVSGLMPTDITSYHKQKLRWCRGNIYAFGKALDFFGTGATWAQKVAMSGVFFAWFMGFSKCIYYFTPSVILLTETFPVSYSNFNYFVYYFTNLFIIIIGPKIASGGYVTLIIDEQYNMLNFFCLIRGVGQSIFSRSKLKQFDVTSKGKPTTPNTLNALAPQIGLALISFWSAMWGVLVMIHEESFAFMALFVVTVWALYNSIVAFSIINKVLSTGIKREVYRAEHTLPVEFLVHTDGHTTLHGLGVTADFHENGLRLITSERLPIHHAIDVTLHLGKNTVHARGTILYMDRDATLDRDLGAYGVEFRNLSRHDKDTIIDYYFNVALPQYFEINTPTAQLPTLWVTQRQRRNSPRRTVAYPIKVFLASNVQNEILTTTCDLNARGVSFVTDRDFEVNTPVGIWLAIGNDNPSVRKVIRGTIRNKSSFRRCNLTRYGVAFDSKFR